MLVRWQVCALLMGLVEGTTVKASVGSKAEVEALESSVSAPEDSELEANDESASWPSLSADASNDGEVEASDEEPREPVEDAAGLDLAELENVEVRKSTGELAADSVSRIESAMESDVGATTWSYVNLGADQSRELMQQTSELSTLSAGTAGLGTRRSYRSATALVGSLGSKATEWSSLALAGRSFMGLFRNASSETPGKLKIFAVEPAQVSISTLKSSDEKGEVLYREQIQTFTSEDNDVLQLTSTGDVIVQSMEESYDFSQLAPVDEAVFGYCHDFCAIMAFDRQATGLVEECTDGSSNSYDKSDMTEETYWSVTPGKACRWRSTDGSAIAGTSMSDNPEKRASVSFLPSAYFQDTTPFPMTLTSVKVIGTQATSCKVNGKTFILKGTGAVYLSELEEVKAKSSIVCDQGVMVMGLAPGLKDTVQLITAPSGRKAKYTKFGSGVCDGSDKFDKFQLEEEYPSLTEEKTLDWKLITTRETPGICNADSVDECFHLCSVVSDCKFFATHFAVNCQACLLFKSCPSRAGQSLMEEDMEGDSSSQTGLDLPMYDIFQLEQADSEVDAEKNLVKNPSFNDGKSGWTELCPPMMYNGKNLTYGCQNEGVSTSISKALGGDTTAYHIKGNCFEGSRGGVYQDIKTQLGYTYEVTFKVIDGWFNNKNSKSEKSWVEVQSPVNQPVMDQEVSTKASAKKPTSGQWETKGPFKFVAAADTSRIFFYSGGTACTNIDDVTVRKTKDPKHAVFSFATLIDEKNFIVTKGSFVSSDNSTAGSSIKVHKDNVVVMKPSESAGDGSAESSEGENDMDINTRDLTSGGCSRVSGFVRYVPVPLYEYDETEVNNGSLTSTVSFEIQEPIGQRLGKVMEIGVTGGVVNAMLDPSPESIRLRVKMEPSVEPEEDDKAAATRAALRAKSVLEVQLNFFCRGGGSSRKSWKLNTYAYTGNEGLCLSVAARDTVGMGCHEVTCRQNPTSDASLQPCNEEDWAQNFYPDGKLLRSASPADRCLAVDYSSRVSATCKPLTLKLCDSSDPGQRWSIQGGRNAQEEAFLKMEDGFVVSVPKASSELASFDMKIQACQEKEVSSVKSWNQLTSPMIADLVMAHELSSNFTQRASFSGELLITKVWAEAICPWYFNPPIHTDSKLIKCYNDELCDPAVDGEDCCGSKGGTFMCSKSSPYMCKAKSNGKDSPDYFCVNENEDCEVYGGRRPCEGPPGRAGSAGEPGDEGEPGEEGPPGMKGFVTDEVKPPSGVKHIFSQPATTTEVIGALLVNFGMAFLVFRNLKAKIMYRLEGKAGSVAPRA